MLENHVGRFLCAEPDGKVSQSVSQSVVMVAVPSCDGCHALSLPSMPCLVVVIIIIIVIIITRVCRHSLMCVCLSLSPTVHSLFSGGGRPGGAVHVGDV